MLVGRKSGDAIKLLVGHLPMDILDDVLDDSGLGMKSKYRHHLLQFFPMKTCTTIGLQPATKIIRIEIAAIVYGLP